MPSTVTISGITYTIEKLDSGNIRVTHSAGQVNPMQGPDTGGVYLFEVHPVQSRCYAYWSELLEDPEAVETGPGAGGAVPWWSAKGWKKDKK
ncbi:MAG: hypothetical protein ACYS0D_12890 [Planctomycetota bacterium]|jgi:hypothetical protein